MTTYESWEVLAVRYGEWLTTRSHTYYRYGVYGEADADLPMSYYFWVVRNGGSTILVDTGFNLESITSRSGRVSVMDTAPALRALDVDAAEVSHVVITHMHYDHIGNLSLFPAAQFHVQRAEFDFWTGPYGRQKAFAASIERREIAQLQQLEVEGRLTLHDGDSAVVPGIELKLVGGHCPGQQVVLIGDERPTVLASDALHYYEEMDRDMPYSVLANLPEMYATYELLRGLRDERGATVVAGHDPLVLQRFEPVKTNGTPFAVVCR